MECWRREWDCVHAWLHPAAVAAEEEEEEEEEEKRATKEGVYVSLQIVELQSGAAAPGSNGSVAAAAASAAAADAAAAVAAADTRAWWMLHHPLELHQALTENSPSSYLTHPIKAMILPFLMTNWPLIIKIGEFHGEDSGTYFFRVRCPKFLVSLAFAMPTKKWFICVTQNLT